MAFDPEVESYFELLKASPVPPLPQLTIEQGRFVYRLKSEKFGGPVVEVAAVEDHKADGPAGPIALRLYRPHNAPAAPAPAMIYAHGGGWVIGDLESHDKLCRNIATAAGCVVIAIDYRLGPEHPFPAAQDDTVAAVKWVAANAAKLGVDSARMGIGGDSAGGSLSAMACLALRDTGGPALRCQALIYPSTDATPDSANHPSRKANGQVPPLTTEVMDYFFEKAMAGATQSPDWRISPLHAASHIGLPPALVITAGYDILCDEGEAYAKALEASGVKVTRARFPGQVHGFIELGGIMKAPSEAVAAIAKLLRENL